MRKELLAHVERKARQSMFANGLGLAHPLATRPVLAHNGGAGVALRANMRLSLCWRER